MCARNSHRYQCSKLANCLTLNVIQSVFDRPRPKLISFPELPGPHARRPRRASTTRTMPRRSKQFSSRQTRGRSRVHRRRPRPARARARALSKHIALSKRRHAHHGPDGTQKTITRLFIRRVDRGPQHSRSRGSHGRHERRRALLNGQPGVLGN